MRLRAATPYLILLAAWALVVAAYAPGEVNGDTVVHLEQIETGAYDDWLSPVLDALWSVPYDLGLRLVPVLMAQVGALIAGLYLLARLFLPRVASAIASSAILLSPPVLSLGGVLGRDTWLAALMLLAAGCLGRCVTADRRTGAVTWTIAFVVLVVLGTSARQNSWPFTFLLLGTAGVAWMARGGRLPARPSRRLLSATLAGLLGVLAVAGVLRVAHGAIGVAESRPQQVTMAFDLVMLSLREDRVLLPRLVYPSQDLDLLSRAVDSGDMELLFRPPGDPSIVIDATGTAPSDERYGALSDAWQSAIRGDPWGYMSVRASHWLRQIGVTAPPSYVAHFDRHADNAGYGYWNPGLHDAADDYVALFSSPDPAAAHDPFARGGVIFRSFLYLIAALGLAALLLLRSFRARRRALLAPGALLLGAAAYEIALGLVLPAARFRWSYPLVVAVMAVGVPAATAALRAWAATRLADRPGARGRWASTTSG